MAGARQPDPQRCSTLERRDLRVGIGLDSAQVYPGTGYDLIGDFDEFSPAPRTPHRRPLRGEAGSFIWLPAML
jgi:hypothetical protein